MALSGNYIKYTTTDSGTTEIKTITYPTNLPKNSIDYEKRGTTEEIEVPVFNHSSESIDNVYLVVTGTSLQKYNGEYHLGFGYRLYPNENTSSISENLTPLENDALYSTTDQFPWNGELLMNAIEEAYEYLKTKPECANMVNA